ncbi:type I-E CRISPR-associated protein Cas6/Cse3/CasE [Streptomyces platensis]|uniref:type I-E CRISPR-associated protein Cas6/Cse3/CasE n=1 Tax=Streptomyces platensis TaxID=58346 RepID=UPI0036CA598D
MTPTPATEPATATLTHIHLNQTSTRVRKDLGDATRLHRTVMLLAPDHLGDHPRQEAGLLFRLEHATLHTPPTLLVQTHQPPNLNRLPTNYGTAQSRDLTPMLHHLTPGRRVRYRITANASTARRVLANHQPAPGKHQRKITALHGDDALAWWHRRATSAGLTLTSADHIPVPAATTPSKDPNTHTDKRRQGLLHALTRFDGLATITNPDQLRHALLTGIGRGKPYGAGLLSLAPA